MERAQLCRASVQETAMGALSAHSREYQAVKDVNFERACQVMDNR